MIALLLNSGLGSRMGDETREHPKCMCRLTEQETIISWQVKLLRRIGVTEAVVTTGHLADTLIAYLESLDSGIRFHFVHNPKYRETNYIYSMYLARNLLRGQDVISLHGDLVLHPTVMDALAELTPQMRVCMTLHYLDGWRVPEIAQMLDIPEGTVKTRLMHARKRMETLLREVET